MNSADHIESHATLADIRPIETVYNGYRFRSRLEARWAVFLDYMGLEWEYEKDGYDLGSSLGWYLPDFWIQHPWRHSKSGGAWLEIKPLVERPADPAEPSLAEEKMAALSTLTNSHGYVAYGQPLDMVQHFIAIQSAWDWFRVFRVDASENLPQAVRAARQARFEHGEHGA